MTRRDGRRPPRVWQNRRALASIGRPCRRRLHRPGLPRCRPAGASAPAAPSYRPNIHHHHTGLARPSSPRVSVTGYRPCRLHAEAWCCANSTRGTQCLCYCLQLATRCLSETALFYFQKPVSESKDKENATDPRRITVVQPSPYETQFLKPERMDAIELALDRPCIHVGHG